MFECIPNISEGRNVETIQAASAAIASTPGVRLLHQDVGFDANRTVFTFIGDETGILEACIRLYQVALERIDLRIHKGEHPRLGAVDVCPIVPLSDQNFEGAKRLAFSVAKVVGERMKIPVFLYEKSQERLYRQRLSDIRRGQFEGLSQKFTLNEWKPDLGPAAPHERFGATVIGARDFLIAYNISLESKDVSVARDIAKVLRDYRQQSEEKKCSLWKAVRAIGWEMPRYGCVQVSTNIVDINRASLADVYIEVTRLAKARGVNVLGSELIGLVPEKAIMDSSAAFNAEAGREIDAAVKGLGLSYHEEFKPNERILEKIITA
jgi:glutamate formiminotransferase